VSISKSPARPSQIQKKELKINNPVYFSPNYATIRKIEYLAWSIRGVKKEPGVMKISLQTDIPAYL
jgi:hypothetical protein